MSLTFATQEVVAPRVRVLFEDPALEEYAQRVAAEAERALDVLIPLFGYEPATITLTVENTTDVYNATASALPRPSVATRALFPTDISLGYRAEDDLYLLLLHELTHVMQLRYTARREGASAGLRLGLVGEGVAALPPGWFIEGLAVWMESEYTLGGRRNDALTTGLVRSAALGEAWPSLAAVSLSSYSAWPGGNARYLYGVGFVDYLIGKYGFDTVLKTLRTYNTRGLFTTFAEAWEAAGISLEDEWAAWREVLREAGTTPAGETLTDMGWYTRAPAVSPDGRRLAWLEHPSAVVVANMDKEEGEFTNKRTLIRDRFLSGLEWLDDDTLLYVRPVRRAGTTFSELFSLDVSTGRERQLTTGARAALPAAAPDGCILYVRDDVTTASQLKRWCGGTSQTAVETPWTAPAGAHIVGLAVSDEGRVALSVWRRGFVDVAVLDGGEVTFLTQDAAQDLDPAWRGETGLVFRSDREPGGVFDLYELDIQDRQLRRLTRTLGGAFRPEVGPDGILYAELGAGGFDIAEMTEPLGETVPLTLEPPPDIPAPITSFPVRVYNPLLSLRPYGWLPNGGGVSLDPFRVAFSASLLGQDDTARHAYALTLGYAGGLGGPLGGAYANVRYDYGGGALVDLSAVPLPLRFGVQVGLWPYAPYGGARGGEAAVVPGLKGSVALTLPADTWTGRVGLEAGVIRLADAWRLDASAQGARSRVYLDTFGYPQRGTRAALTGVWRATPAGPLPGAWADGVYYFPTNLFGLPGTVELGGRGGYQIAPPVPVRLGSFAALGTAGYRVSLPVGWRYGDGLYALERVTVEPRVRGWLGTSSSVGADLTLSLDTVLNYSAPLSLSATLGYADGFWTRFGVRLPL